MHIKKKDIHKKESYVWKERNNREVMRYKLVGLRQVEAEYVNRILCRNLGLLDTILM